MSKRIFLLLTAASLSFPFGAYAEQLNLEINNPHSLAQNHARHGRRHNRGKKMNQIWQQLDLTPEQSQQIEAIQQEFKTKNVALE